MVADEIETTTGAEIDRMKRICQQMVAGLYNPVTGPEDGIEIDPEIVLRLIHELEQSREILEPLSRLLRGLNASVTLHAEDPRLKRKFSLKTKDVSKIVVSSQRTKWKDVEVKGESMAHALTTAAARFGETDEL